MSKSEDSNKSMKDKVLLEIDTFPFKGLNISDNWKKLDSIESRSNCSKCKKSRKYFCYTCCIAVPEVQTIIPAVKLPVQVDIIKHAREMDGKSTAVHAAVLAPGDVRIYTYPCIPDYDSQENVVLVFPNKEAVTVEEMCTKFFRRVRLLDSKRACPNTRHSVVHRVVFIDSTWNQSRGIFKDPRIKALPSVVLKSRLSQFWRHQADSPRWYLATIEAIHQFLVELDAAQWHLDHSTAPTQGEASTNKCTSHELLEDVEPENSRKGFQENNNTTESDSTESELLTESAEVIRDGYIYNGSYDNLLFFFRFMYSKIHTLYDHDQLRSYKRRLE